MSWDVLRHWYFYLKGKCKSLMGLLHYTQYEVIIITILDIIISNLHDSKRKVSQKLYGAEAVVLRGDNALSQANI